jgi:hypothetical protein
MLALVAGGCATPGYHRVKPTPLDQAQVEVPEDQLLDVGVALSAAPERSEKQLEKEGTNEDIRKSECKYVPFHLKNTLQRSSYWGSVQVVPEADDEVDLTVTSELVKSNGEIMQFKVEAVDALGRRWLKRNYEAKAGETNYQITTRGQRDAFQDVYNTVANDLSSFLQGLSPEDVEEIRRAAKLKFAADFAPDAFAEYITTNGKGKTTVLRLPADDDPLMDRIDRIRERDAMFVDTLNQYYEGFYDNMWDAYENWRRYNLAEQEALRRVQGEAFLKTVAGVLMIAAAIALDAGNTDLGALSGILILAGGQVVINGVNVSQQAEIHASAIQELSATFGTEMRPTVLELEGKQYQLTGTAAEQYEKWRDLLRRIYFEETGFAASEPGAGSDGSEPATTTGP